MLSILNTIALIVGWLTLASLPCLWLWAKAFGGSGHDPRDSGE